MQCWLEMSLRDLKDENRIVIWPSYFLSNSRSKGRRVRKIQYKITIEDILTESKNLGLDPIIIKDKKYPRDKKVNLIISVKKIKSKNYTIKLIFNNIVAKVEKNRNN